MSSRNMTGCFIQYSFGKEIPIVSGIWAMKIKPRVTQRRVCARMPVYFFLRNIRYCVLRSKLGLLPNGKNITSETPPAIDENDILTLLGRIPGQEGKRNIFQNR